MAFIRIARWRRAAGGFTRQVPSQRHRRAGFEMLEPRQVLSGIPLGSGVIEPHLPMPNDPQPPIGPLPPIPAPGPIDLPLPWPSNPGNPPIMFIYAAPDRYLVPEKDGAPHLLDVPAEDGVLANDSAIAPMIRGDGGADDAEIFNIAGVARVIFPNGDGEVPPPLPVPECDYPLMAVEVDAPANGQLTLHADGSFTYLPNAGFTGVDTFTYKATDGHFESDVAVVSIGVGIDQIPIAPMAWDDWYGVEPGDDESANDESGDNQSGDAGTIDVSSDEGVLANDYDENGDPLTAVLVTEPANGQLTFHSDGSFTYVADAGFQGIDTFTYQASDGQLDSEIATVWLCVGSIEIEPWLYAEDDYYGIDEGSTDLAISAEDGVLANDYDEAGLPLTATLVDAPAHGQVEFNADGSFDYVPDDTFDGEDWFTYTASNGSLTSNLATVSICTYLWQNPIDSDDVNHDGVISGIDLIMVIDALNQNAGGVPLPPVLARGPGALVDVDGDNCVTSMDLLTVASRLNTPGACGSPVVSKPPARGAPSNTAVEVAFEQLSLGLLNARLAASTSDSITSAGLKEMVATPSPNAATSVAPVPVSAADASRVAVEPDSFDAALADLAVDVSTVWKQCGL